MAGKADVVDRQARDRAACLLEQIRDGQIATRELLRQWPRLSKDRALLQVQLYVSNRMMDTARMVTQVQIYGNAIAPLSDEDRELLDRAARFLRTDSPYKWPRRWGAAGLLLPLAVLAAPALIALGIVKGIADMSHRGVMGLVQWVSGTTFLAGLLLIWAFRLMGALAKRPIRRWKEFGSESHWPFASQQDLAAATPPAPQ